MQEIETLSLGQILPRAAESVPDKIALVDDDRRKSYKELNDMVDSLANGLVDIGLKKGDRVAIYMKSSIEFITAFFALEKMGIIVAWVNPHYRAADAGFILKNSESRGVFIFREWEDYDYLASISDLRENLPDLEYIIVAGQGEGKDVHDFYNLIEQGGKKKYPAPDIDINEDLAMLIYTSGTTGKPKGAMITHHQAVKAGYQYSLGVNASSEDIFIGVLPMSHSYGCGATLIQPFLIQATLVLMADFHPEKALELIEKEKVSIQMAAPIHYILEVNHKNLKKYDITSLRAGLIAGQPAPEGLITRVEKEMGVYLTSFWGASEVGPGMGIMCPYPSPLEIREKYIGLPIEGTEVKVVDPSTGQEVPGGEVGELILSGWHVLKGYWKNPEETKNQVIDGWLYTGDLVSKDSNGYFRIYGRSKDMINRGGYKIYPSDLESLISRHPKVEEVCVVATPNPVLGESICACVIPKQGQTINLKEIRQFLEGKLAQHKMPDELSIMKGFPRLSGGVKINKFGKDGLAELAKMDDKREGLRR